MTLSRRALLSCAAGLLLLPAGCGGGGGGSAPAQRLLHLEFERVTAPADGSFRAVVWLSTANAALVSFPATPTLTSSRGSVSAWSVRGDGKHEATVTPDALKSGEYVITAQAAISGSTASVSRTAVVTDIVANGWGQATSVDGLVNTAGTQDSLAVSPDGEYLFLQYYPLSLSCILSADPDSTFCQTPRGPIAAPERPDLPGAERVGTTSVQHGCPSLNFDPAPFPVPPIAIYGFHRQDDGSYAEPFALRFTGGDGCFGAWGPSAHANGDGTYRLFVSFNDPRNSGTASDFAHIYDFTLPPAAPPVLGHVSLGAGGAIQIENFVLNQATVGGADVHRGNPHVSYNGATPALLFYDDELQPTATQFIHVSQWTGSSWGAPVALDFAPFNASGFGETQPYFDGSQLIVRNGLQLLTYAYNGGAFGSAASWSGPVILLGPGGQPPETGALIVAGEPTVAVIDGRDVLFFVYGIWQADGSINLRVGQLPREP